MYPSDPAQSTPALIERVFDMAPNEVLAVRPVGDDVDFVSMSQPGAAARIRAWASARINPGTGDWIQHATLYDLSTDAAEQEYSPFGWMRYQFIGSTSRSEIVFNSKSKLDFYRSSETVFAVRSSDRTEFDLTAGGPNMVIDLYGLIDSGFKAEYLDFVAYPGDTDHVWSIQGSRLTITPSTRAGARSTDFTIQIFDPCGRTLNKFIRVWTR